MKRKRSRKVAKDVDWTKVGGVVVKLVGPNYGVAGFCRARREELGLTQEDLGLRIGRSVSWVSMFERGELGMLSDVEGVFAALGVSSVLIEL